MYRTLAPTRRPTPTTLIRHLRRFPTPGKRVVDLRKLLVLTQKELSSLSGISQSCLSDIERGNLELTPVATHRICSATATPTSFFHYSTPSYCADNINFSKSSRVSAKQRDFVIQAFKEIERISAVLAEAPVRLKRVGIPVAEQSDIISEYDLDLLAGDIRKSHRLDSDAPIRNVTHMMERAGIAVASMSVPLGNDTLLEGHCGVSHWSGRSPRASVGFVTGMAGDRQRFTLAHEFAHVVLHSWRTVSDPKQREREADYFAGALLLPRLCAEEAIAESLTLGGYMQIKAEFGISIHAIVTRAQRLGLITRDRQRSLMIQLSSRGWREKEPINVGCESPVLLHTELVALYGAHPYYAASSALGVSPALLQSWIPEPNNGPRDS
jgi:Zn-dependent peptidase ImmA (M78 family)/transcriptional regulator with XRE-family HTH domain